jgi:nitrite reductase/ring-hydroxylating ferredoxin subunit
MPDSLDTRWTRVLALDELVGKGRAVVRLDGRQIALFATAQGVFACNNRCPHEGYPLREGSLGADGDPCVLTCNWHNWKFDLRDGANLYGGDRLRTYPVRVTEGSVWLDLADPPPATRRAAIMANLRDAFDDEDYERMARELARLRLVGGELTAALAEAICWAHDRLEFGWTHAYAGAADWLALHDMPGRDDETRLVCVLETVAHIARDVLREGVYPYPLGERAWDEDGFVGALDAEDEATAAAMIRGALAAGQGFAALERGFTRAALLHYADFGHCLIYVAKVGALIGRLGDGVALPLLLSLARNILKASREDLIPEFRGYARALAAWSHDAGAVPAASDYRGLNVDRALALTARAGGADPLALYDALLAANADSMLHFDTRYQTRSDLGFKHNVGWLDFTHGITFAQAVRRQCTRFPELWPQGLLQMACFPGRNARYIAADVDVAHWHVTDRDSFFAGMVDMLFDHGQPEPIIAVHLLKTTLAARDEAAHALAPETAALVAAALNRFLHTPMKRKHVRRTVRQAADFVALDG